VYDPRFRRSFERGYSDAYNSRQKPADSRLNPSS
jgi:hypothetical protein